MRVGTTVAGGVLGLDSGAGTETMTLDGSGNVGINVTPEASHAPSLTIKYGGNNITSRGNADFRIMSGAFQDGASTFQYAVSSYPVSMLSMTNGGFAVQSAPAGTDGNAATFTTKFYVDPDGTISTPTLGTSNVRFGVNAGDAIQSGGNYNVCIGDEAGTAITTADNNVAVGYQALLVSADASNNTAVGVNSMASHTGGVKNVAVGGSSLTSSVNTAEQTAVGYEALKNSVGAGGGGGNTALGYASMRDTTTGVYNTALGYASAYDGILTGNYNTFVGALAGRNLAGDEDTSTFVGYSSGSLMTSGEKNVILGSYNGNQSGLNIIGLDNYIVASDGDGVPKWYNTDQGRNIFNTTAGSYSVAFQHSGAGGYGVFAELSNANHNHYFAGYNGSSYDFIVGGGGNVTNTNNSYGAISDVKLKENISDASSQWDDVKALSIRKYSMKKDNLNEANQLGVIAQEVEAAGMGGLVETTSDIDRDGVDLGTETKAVKYSILYMKAVKALQEAMTRIEALETKVTALEGA